MTSTSFNVGLTDNTRLSSRVLRPPGGGHTDIFGGEPEPQRGRRAGYPQAPSQIGQGDEPKPTNGTEPSQNGQDRSPVEPKAPEPEPQQQQAPARPESIDIPKPAETEKPAPEKTPEAKPQELPKAEPPKRVRVPPGGFSSGLW